MQGPDEGSPTIPGPQQPNRPPVWFESDDAQPMGNPTNAPPATNNGPPPVWDIPTTPQAPGGGPSPNLRNFGLGFAIALIVLAVMALVLIVVFVVDQNGTKVAQTSATALPTQTFTPQPSKPTSTPLPPIDTTTAANTAEQYYTFINSQQYQSAYNMLSQNYQSQHTLDQFTQSWQNTESVTFDPNSVSANAGSDNTVNVNLTYTQTLNDNTSKVVQATLRVGYDGGLVRILKISTQNVAPTETPPPNPTETPTPEISPTPTATLPPG
jgi:hypothetical protein